MANADDKSLDQTRGKQASALGGTTLKVYRFLYKEGKAVGIRDIQRGLALSSPSVAQYHVKKLLESGLVKEQDQGYAVDRTVFENMIRIRRSLIPLQIAYAVFYATMLGALFILFYSSYDKAPELFIFAAVVTLSALGLFASQAFRNRNYPT